MTITILHKIFLTHEERYKLIAGEEIQVVGISVPVWFSKGKTTEPAEEIFCKYKLCNKEESIPISNREEGYIVNMPQPHETMYKLIDTLLPNAMIGETVSPPSIENLKDIADGGDESLNFKQYTKMKRGKKIYNILHFVEIKTIEKLESSLAY